DPSAPAILWERTPAVVRSEVEPGAGLSLAMSLVKTATGATHVTFASSNNGGTGGAGALLQAIDTATGEVLWSHFAGYPMPRVEDNPRVPASGIPAGPTALDRAGVGFASHILLPTLFGDLWMFEAASGESV